jgi:hypothetical protein
VTCAHAGWRRAGTRAPCWSCRPALNSTPIDVDFLIMSPRLALVALAFAAWLVLQAAGELLLAFAVLLAAVTIRLWLDWRAERARLPAEIQRLRDDSPALGPAERADRYVQVERGLRLRGTRSLAGVRRELDISPDALAAARARAEEAEESGRPTLSIDSRFLLLVFVVFPGIAALIAVLAGLIKHPATDAEFMGPLVLVCLGPALLTAGYLGTRRGGGGPNALGWSLAAGAVGIFYAAVVAALVLP